MRQWQKIMLLLSWWWHWHNVNGTAYAMQCWVALQIKCICPTSKGQASCEPVMQSSHRMAIHWPSTRVWGSKWVLSTRTCDTKFSFSMSGQGDWGPISASRLQWYLWVRPIWCKDNLLADERSQCEEKTLYLISKAADCLLKLYPQLKASISWTGQWSNLTDLRVKVVCKLQSI